MRGQKCTSIYSSYELLNDLIWVIILKLFRTDHAQKHKTKLDARNNIRRDVGDLVRLLCRLITVRLPRIGKDAY